MSIQWSDGIDNYKEHEVYRDSAGQIFYKCNLVDKSLNYCNDLLSQVDAILSCYKFTKINLLYSGGLDSELLLVALSKLGFNVEAYTMRLCLKGYPLNVLDLYYSEKFSRNHNIAHKFIDLDVEKFFTNGEHVKYLMPYYIVEPHVATHFWLMEQCDDFPILAGEYSWPWVQRPVLSPHRLEYSCYDRFLKDRSISGIGNFWNHSFNLNYFLIQQHRRTQILDHTPTDWANIPIFKSNFYSELLDHTFESRCRSYGWETPVKLLFDKSRFKNELLSLYPATTQHRIGWGAQMSELLGSSEQTNDKFY